MLDVIWCGVCVCEESEGLLVTGKCVGVPRVVPMANPLVVGVRQKTGRTSSGASSPSREVRGE